MDIKLKYDVNGRETERKFSNGVSQNTYYDKAGRVIIMTQKTSGNEITWGEAYLYGADGKREKQGQTLISPNFILMGAN